MKHQFLTPIRSGSISEGFIPLNRSSRNLTGFTLIELIVAVGVLAIFATFLLTTLNPFEQFKKAADAQRKNDLAQIQRAIEAYYQDFGTYPASSNNKISYNSSTLEWGSTWSPYIDVLPKDPSGSNSYIYVSGSNGQSYFLYASLDRGGKDPQACNSAGTACPNVPLGVTCGSGKICNYGVSSPNVSP